jgi:hypothetical protein
MFTQHDQRRREMQRPQPNDCAEYYFRYIDLVPDVDVLGFLEQQLTRMTEFLGGITEEKSNYRYADDKWSIKEVVGHINDTERVFAYRALWFARNNTEPIPGMEQDDFVEFGDFGHRSLLNLTEEFRTIRASTLTMLRGISEEAALRKGVASGVEFTVSSIPWIIAGHAMHHRQVLKEKYL